MANLSKTTKDHAEIQRWAEERGGKPSHVKSTSSPEEVGILRIDFSGFGGESALEGISWDDFFQKFDAQNLVLVYEEELAGGERSNFNKLISGDSPDSAAERLPVTPAKRVSRAGSAGKPALRKIPARQTKKSGVSKTAAKKAIVKKATPRTAARKAAVPGKVASPARKTGNRQTAVVKKAASKAVKKVAAGKGPAKKAAPKKFPAKKVAAKKLPAKKAAAKRVIATKKALKTASRKRR